MTYEIVSGEYQEQLKKFASEIIGLPLFEQSAKAIGMFDEKGIVVSVVYDGFSSDNSRVWNDCQMHVAARPMSKWATKDFLFHAFNYPFNILGCSRVTGLVRIDNIAAQKFDERIGFIKEGVLREGQDGTDLIVYGMLKRECRWI